MKIKGIQYNSPVILTFSLISVIALILGVITGGKSTTLLFCVYRSSLKDPLTYIRFFTHVLGHANYEHYIGNILLMLVVGPSVEEKFGSSNLLKAMLVTAFVSGFVQWLFFPNAALLGASGIVFMLFVMASMGGMSNGMLPLTLILVMVFYVGGEIADLALDDSVSQLSHIIGGVCGAVMGLRMSTSKRGRRSK